MESEPPREKHRLRRSFPVTEVTTYGIVEIHSASHSLSMSDAKVAYGFDGRGKVRRQSRFGLNLPQTSLSVFSPKILPLPTIRLKGIQQRKLLIENSKDGRMLGNKTL
ncbi:MAG TPA: hypothetical protein K8W10_00300 [Parabacteroides distasonis]|nr:hypothetical protein [Parabacteroides distasonis]